MPWSLNCRNAALRCLCMEAWYKFRHTRIFFDAMTRLCGWRRAEVSRGLRLLQVKRF